MSKSLSLRRPVEQRAGIPIRKLAGRLGAATDLPVSRIGVRW
jgi:hypothetical protein